MPVDTSRLRPPGPETCKVRACAIPQGALARTRPARCSAEKNRPTRSGIWPRVRGTPEQRSRLFFQQPTARNRLRGPIETDWGLGTLRPVKKLLREAGQKGRDRVTAHHPGRELWEKAPDQGLATPPKTLDKARKGAIFKQKEHSCEPDHTSVGWGVTGAQGVHRARADHVQTERSERKEERPSAAPSERKFEWSFSARERRRPEGLGVPDSR